VIIQATSGAVFNYTTDCYIIELPGHTGSSQFFVGAGKLVAGTFTGIVAFASGSGLASTGFVVGALTGTASTASGGIATAYLWCGSDTACTWTTGTVTPTMSSYSGAQAHRVVGVASLPVATSQKCYP
jgi:hypothetical protein